MEFLEEDLIFYSNLHSWYKHGDYTTVIPMLRLGNQPYHPVCPQLDPKKAHQYRWWFICVDDDWEKYSSGFRSKEECKMAFDEAQKYPVLLTNQFGSAGKKHEKVMSKLRDGATKFYASTRHIWEHSACAKEEGK